MLNFKVNDLPWRWFIFILSLAALDQFTKYWAMKYIQPQITLFPLPFLLLHLEYNPGIGFSLLGQLGSFLILLMIMGMLNILFIMYDTFQSKQYDSLLKSIGFSFILGGGMGNLYDRCVIGAVVDFMSICLWKWWLPLFNFADVFITIGLLCLYISPVFRIIKSTIYKYT